MRTHRWRSLVKGIGASVELYHWYDTSELNHYLIINENPDHQILWGMGGRNECSEIICSLEIIWEFWEPLILSTNLPCN